jgi:iron complex transport system substrate-binding protein
MRPATSFKIGLPALFLLLFLCFAPLTWAQVTVTDFHGRTVDIPENIQRVVVVDDGMVEGVMTRLGCADKIVALGSACVPRIWEYAYPKPGGADFEFKNGMNPVTLLNPGFRDLPLVAKFGTGVQYERVAALKPDLIILRTGSCTLSGSRDVLEKSIGLLDSLGIPMVVLHGPNTFDQPRITTISKEIRLLGKVFGKENEADDLADYLESCVNQIRMRTESIPASQRKRLLLLGLSPKARSQGGAAHVKGQDTIQTFFITDYVNASNAYEGRGAWNILNTEQILALDPDAIILVTAWGYQPPEELYHSPHYAGLSHMRAIKERRVAALPWTPCNCEKRLEYPVDVMVMAKTAYPKRFQDIQLDKWVLAFYQKVYGVDRATAMQILSCQWMEWTLEK